MEHFLSIPTSTTLESSNSLPSGYVSLIRYGGRPILPPVVSASLKEEIRQYKALAIQREKELACRRENCSPVATSYSGVTCQLSELPLKFDCFTKVSAGESLTHQSPHHLNQATVAENFSLPDESILTGNATASSPRGHVTFAENGVQHQQHFIDDDMSTALTTTESTDLLPYIHNLQTDESCAPGGTSSRTITENVAPSLLMDVSQFNADSQTPVATASHDRPLLRSDSFLVDTPSEALLNSSLVSAKVQATPTGSPNNKHAYTRYSCLSSSPVISARIARLIGQIKGDMSAQILQEKLHDCVSLQETLHTYHELQLQELQLRQEQERHALDQQIQLLRDALAQSTTELLSRSSVDHSVPQVQYFLELKDDATTSLSPRPVLSSELRSPSARSSVLHRRLVPKALKMLLPAFVRGHLTRCLMRTERVQTVIKTIRDVRAEIELEQPGQNDDPSVFAQRLEVQPTYFSDHLLLKSALTELHQIFFEWPSAERMVLLQRQRDIAQFDHRKAREPLERRLSSATMKSLMRKQQRAVGALQVDVGVKPLRTSKTSKRNRLSVGLAQRVRVTPRLSGAVTRSPRRIPRQSNMMKTRVLSVSQPIATSVSSWRAPVSKDGSVDLTIRTQFNALTVTKKKASANVALQNEQRSMYSSMRPPPQKRPWR